MPGEVSPTSHPFLAVGQGRLGVPSNSMYFHFPTTLYTMRRDFPVKKVPNENFRYNSCRLISGLN